MPISVSTTVLPRTVLQDAAGPRLPDAAAAATGGAAAEAADVVALSADALLRLMQEAPGFAPKQPGRPLGASSGLDLPVPGAAPLALPDQEARVAQATSAGETADKRRVMVSDDAHPPAADPAPAVPLAAAMLRVAGEALALLKRQPRDAPAPDAAGPDGAAAVRQTGPAVAMPSGAQLALAPPQIARRVPETAPPSRARRGRTGPAAAAAGRHGPDQRGRQLLLARRGLTVILLVLAAAALWVATTLDLTLARAACVALLGALCSAAAWRWSARRGCQAHRPASAKSASSG